MDTGLVYLWFYASFPTFHIQIPSPTESSRFSGLPAPHFAPYTPPPLTPYNQPQPPIQHYPQQQPGYSSAPPPDYSRPVDQHPEASPHAPSMLVQQSSAGPTSPTGYKVSVCQCMHGEQLL